MHRTKGTPRIVAVVAECLSGYPSAIDHARMLSRTAGVVAIPVAGDGAGALNAVCESFGVERRPAPLSAMPLASVDGVAVGNDRVVLCEPGPIEAAAGTLADATGRIVRTVVTTSDLARAVSRIGASGIVLATEGSVILTAATKLLSGCAEGAPPVGTFGLLTARSPETLTFLVFKTLLHRIRPPEGALLIEEDQCFIAEGGRPGLQPADEARGLGHALTRTFGLLAFTAHGDHIDAGVGGQILCGRSPGASLTSHHVDTHPERPTEPCMSAGLCKRQIHRPAELVYAGDVRAGIILAASCSGAPVTSSIFPSALWMMYAALEGHASAWVASTKIIRPVPALPRITHSALNAGLTLGESVALLNRIQHAVWEEAPALIIYGDPEARTSDHTNAITIPRTLSATGIGGSFRVSRGREGIAVTLLRDAKLRRAIDCHNVRVDVYSEPARNVLCVVLPSDTPDESEAWTFFLDDIPAEVVVTISPAASAAHLQHIERATGFLDRLFDVCSNPAGELRPTPGLAAMVADLAVARETALAILRLGRALAYRRGPALASSATLDDHRLQQMTEIGQEALVRRWQQWDVPLAFYPFYNRFLKTLGAERSGGPCEHCGSLSFEVASFDPCRPEIARAIRYCQRCAIISDQSSDLTSCRLLAPSRLHVGRPTKVSVQIDPPFTGATVHAALRIDCPGHWIEMKATPSWSKVQSTAQPMVSTSFNLELDPRSVPGAYYLQAVVIADFAFSILQKPVWICASEVEG